MPENEVFEDVVLEIRSLADRGFEVRLATASFGEVTAEFVPPVGPEALGAVLNGVVRDLDSPRERTPPEAYARELGSKLFTALLPAKLLRLFDPKREWLDEVDPAGRDRRLRLRLRLDLEDAAVRPLAALPWELLHDPMFNIFYGHGRRRLLVRQLGSAQVATPLAMAPPLRILGVASSPRGATPLDLETEARVLGEALRNDGRLKVLPLAGPTLKETLRALERERPHVLHFMGHGGFDPATGEGHLLFEDGAGGAKAVDGELFAELLKDFRDLRLVVLNACRTAEMPRSASQSPGATVGAALSLRGFPAVVAMQFPIADEDAIRFSKVFYASLAAGEPVDVAVGEGRRALYVIHRRSPDWAAPVLFLRAKDGRIFDLPRRTEPPAAVPAPVNPLVLGIRSFEPWGDHPETTLDLRGPFDGRIIRDPVLWQTEILPKLKGFLHDAAKDRRPLHLDFAAHVSIAFAAGWILEAKSGLDISIRQRQQGRPDQYWSLADAPIDCNPDDAPLPEGPFWKAEDDLILDESAVDVAVAVGITWPLLADVRAYLDRERLPIRRLVRATLSPEPGPGSVKSGAHCLALAQTLALRIRTRTAEEHPGTLHLFLAAPNVFPFYLGQLARGLGRIQMYEHAYEAAGEARTYTPSIRLP